MTKRHFRPICPDWLWRSAATSELNEGERGTIAYLLTSPFGNYAGVFEIVPRVAAAEMRVSMAKFRARIKRLEELDLIATDGNYILVKPWFMNASWQVFLKPKATARVPTLRAIQQVPTRLVAEWSSSAEASGVPPAIITRFLSDAKLLAETGEEPADDSAAAGVPCADGFHTLSIADGDGLENNTTAKEDPNASNTTTRTGSGGQSTGVQNSVGEAGLLLNDLAEPHRHTLMAATKDLPPRRRQELADELSACLEAAALGKRGPITSVKAWITALAEEVRAGFSVASRGLEIARAREAEQRRLAEAQRQAERRTQERAQESARTQAMQDALARCSAEEKAAVLAAALASASQSPGRPFSNEVRDQVLAGQLPGALAGVHVRKALQDLNLIKDTPPAGQAACGDAT